MRAVGLLAGIGTLLREAREAGCDVVGNYETRRPFLTDRRVWTKNWGAVPLVDDERIAALCGAWYGADIALGHPPCGSQSNLGAGGHSLDLDPAHRKVLQAKRAGKVGLLPLFVKLVNTFEPRCFALDNLPKILGTIAPVEWWETVLPQYRLTFATIVNWDYGTPQLRQRLWVIGVRRPGRAFTLPRAPQRDGPANVRQALAGLPWEPWRDLPDLAHVHAAPGDLPQGSYPTLGSPPGYIRETDVLAQRYLALPPKEPWPYRTRTTDRVTSKFGRARLDGFQRSSVVSSGTLQHPLSGWPLTARERARLMDWPDDLWLGDASVTYDRAFQNRLNFYTGKAVPSRFPRFLIPHLLRHLQRRG